jgi:hypothetical protein
MHEVHGTRPEQSLQRFGFSESGRLQMRSAGLVTIGESFVRYFSQQGPKKDGAWRALDDWKFQRAANPVRRG